MNDSCLFEIMAMPESTLRRALPKVSSRMIVRLVCAYPRVAGRPLMEILRQCLSQSTFEFLKEEINTGLLPTIPEIRLAEAELAKALRDEVQEEETFRLAA